MKKEKTLKQIDLMGSSSCNLNCSYCYINKNCSFFDYDKAIKEAWEKQTYLNTVKKVIDKLNLSTNTVEDIQLWGGEPTLHMKSICKSGTQLGQLFPNITNFLIPTNWYQIDIKALIDFIYELDKNLTPREKSENRLNFHIQASVDGPPGDFNTHGHHVSWEQYKKNFDEFCDYIGTKEELKNTNIVFSQCGTSTQYLILKNFDTFEKIWEFRKYIKKVNTYILDRIEKVTNANLILSARLWTPRIAISQNTTLEEAVKLQPITRMFEYCDLIENNFQEKSYDNEIQHYWIMQGESNYLNRNHECPESNEEALTIMPDGTIVECPCTFLQNLDTYKQELLDAKNYWEYKSALIREPNFYNPLNQDEEKSEYHSWYVFGGGYLGTQSTYINLNLSMAYEMALSGQIDEKYVNNIDLLIKHYMAGFMTAECYREHVNVNHNHFLADHNLIRRWYNGYAEYSYENHKMHMNNKLEAVLKRR